MGLCRMRPKPLDDLVTCVDCVAEFNVDCADRAAVPQLASYPDVCALGTTAPTPIIGPTFALTATPMRTVTATLTATPNVVAPGEQQLKVSWVLPRARPTRWDWVAIFKVGQRSEDYSEDRWEYTNGAASGTMTFTAPTVPGEYEFRYLLDDGFIDIARSGRVTVR